MFLCHSFIILLSFPFSGLRQSQGLNSTFTKAGRCLNSTYQKSPPTNDETGGLGHNNHQNTSNNTTFEVIRDAGQGLANYLDWRLKSF